MLDDGLPFRGELRTLPSAADLLDGELGALPEGGYGLRMAQALLDSLAYRRLGGRLNLWRLVKRRPAHPLM